MYLTVERQADVSSIRSAAEPRWNVFQIGVLLCLVHVMQVTVLGRCAIDSCYLGARRIKYRRVVTVSTLGLVQ